MHYRRNINCLSTDELHDLREALAAMYALPATDPNSFARLASFHGGPPVSYCSHGAPGFFTWHRAYLVAFENALRLAGCRVTLPYWDWSSGPSIGVPAACREATYVNRAGATVDNPLYSGPRAGSGKTVRGANVDTASFSDLATSVQAAMNATTFESFQNQINGPHGSVHVRVGGDMGSVPTASYDPIFYLHHANVDRIWAQWQTAHPGSLPSSEATFQLLPFPRPFSAEWQTGTDVESTVALGYGYRRFCLFLPPFKVWETVRFEWPPRHGGLIESVRIKVKSHHMQPRPVEIRAFVDDPQASSHTALDGNLNFGGAAAFFGHGSPDPHGTKAKSTKAKSTKANTSDHGDHGDMPRPAPQPGVHERFDLEIDLTRALQNRRSDKAEVELRLIAVDGDGREVPPDELLIEEVVIELE
jgi:hypothetical protein